VLVDERSGATFFDGFDFENIIDPTHGVVSYVDGPTAKRLGLVSIDPRGRAWIAVENHSVAAAAGRPSVRLQSKATYEQGLFVIDVEHMPEGNAVWPAFWTVGEKWPAGGEIDILEGVNDQPRNAITLHTRAGCSMAAVDEASTMTGHYVQRDCHAGPGGVPTLGCSTNGPDGSFGPAFNAGGGGIFAMRWTTDAIDVWIWPRAAIPPDLEVGSSPRPETWGKPVSHFALGAACTPDHFGPQRIILNTTLCGDWAGNVFVGGPTACRDYVLGTPSAFDRAYWQIAYIRAFATRTGEP
jgi:hypothetical protein